MSVSYDPESYLRFRCSFEYLRILSLHSKFRFPLSYSSLVVFFSACLLKKGVTANQHRLPTYPLRPINPNNTSPICITAAAGTDFARAFSIFQQTWKIKKFTTQRAFILHVIWLDQAFAHCPRFPTAAFRKSLGRVSVPVWLDVLSNQLKIFGLVELLPHQLPNLTQASPMTIILSTIRDSIKI